ncbi:efflux transporter outer membrane subunit [Paraburkholderia rhizosphaerae]|uniref:NodT family efflux transporter outer membrane factor (OMF) lipoprotein n=1 Tax=Paraburkholderia rhizosphaerae TaxID=480658 RepID=A0A4R8LWN5_9BURK|nr:efflux transporter outer membrane subunit [Paraburkholderia rhizosphaerae]TDY52363.1 NodT family efflux transporter outer membrane factor (OMF) lipoprotein [Paraburkholderia rhizosphaerae]
MKPLLLKALAAAAVLTLAACAVQPASHNDLPETVKTVAPSAWSVDTPRDTVDANTWWSQFGDPVMHDLVLSVLNDNLDVKAAVERVKQAQDDVKVKHSALLPELDATATAAHTRQILPPPLGYVDAAGVGLSANWQPDVFGGERLAVLAAQAQVSGRESALNELRLALAANTAAAYINLRWAQSELQILNDNEQIRSRALKLTQDRLRYGLSTQLDVARAQNQLQDLQARIPRVQSEIQHQLSLIAVFSGRTPESVSSLLLTDARAIPVPSQGAPVTLPSEALLRRPDVRTAYAKVEQRAAEVGVARSERYPKFQLNLTDGLLAASWVGTPTLTDNLFSAALSATSPIFNAGRITANIDASESRMRESQLALDQTMLNALKEIEDTRSDLVSGATQVERLGGALSSSDKALKLSTQLYKGGASSFLDVLDAQQAYLLNAESLNEAKRTHAQSAVALYRSLGGGWDASAADAVAANASEPAGAMPAATDARGSRDTRNAASALAVN